MRRVVVPVGPLRRVAFSQEFKFQLVLFLLRSSIFFLTLVIFLGVSPRAPAFLAYEEEREKRRSCPGTSAMDRASAQIRLTSLAANPPWGRQERGTRPAVGTAAWRADTALLARLERRLRGGRAAAAERVLGAMVTGFVPKAIRARLRRRGSGRRQSGGSAGKECP